MTSGLSSCSCPVLLCPDRWAPRRPPSAEQPLTTLPPCWGHVLPSLVLFSLSHHLDPNSVLLCQASLLYHQTMPLLYVLSFLAFLSGYVWGFLSPPLPAPRLLMTGHCLVWFTLGSGPATAPTRGLEPVRMSEGVGA